MTLLFYLSSSSILLLILRYPGFYWDAAHEGVDAGAFFLELSHLFALQLAAARHVDAHGVYVAVIDQNFIVQVRARRAAC